MQLIEGKRNTRKNGWMLEATQFNVSFSRGQFRVPKSPQLPPATELIKAEWRINPKSPFLPRKFHGQRCLADQNPWDHKESDTTELLCTDTHTHSYSQTQRLLAPWEVKMLVTRPRLTLCNLFGAVRAPLSMEFSKQEYWSWQPFPSPGDLPDPRIEPGSAALLAASRNMKILGLSISDGLHVKRQQRINKSTVIRSSFLL